MITQTQVEELREAAGRGAVRFDTVKPGWVTWMNQDTLQMEWPSDCAVGQAFPAMSYREALDLLGVGPGEDPGVGAEQAYYGFTLPESSFDNYASEAVRQDRRQMWDALKAAWIQEIRVRRTTG